ncbi:MAG: hypothetical protein EHM13_07135 [Acidobacteria bacterium]|nr:MAG: hypothetical protein EHM13_07135 [Acidobacteriota bacterium]
MRTHAERWLEANRSRMSGAQIAAMQEAIAFLTPEIYRQPDKPELVEQERAIKDKLTCVVGRDKAARPSCCSGRQNLHLRRGAAPSTPGCRGSRAA